MSSVAARFAKSLRVYAPSRHISSFARSQRDFIKQLVGTVWISNLAPCSVVGLQRSSKIGYSTMSFDGNNGNDGKSNGIEEDDDDFITEKPELQPQGVDPRRGWGFRGVHKAIICGKVGQTPVQKILRNGKIVTIFTVGTGGMFDQRDFGAKDLPKPAQWHRIAVHNDPLGAYAVQQLVKKYNSTFFNKNKISLFYSCLIFGPSYSSSVYVEGDIETRVYNDSINGEVKNVPEICVRRDGTQHSPILKFDNVSTQPFEDLFVRL
ncbi:mitochondrially targeted single-stranded DNA binding protein [Actinidia rufa]|uniref:Mitochondrially targeted single-stranded DNA binding protein n=1 Tax=Actinidia rufa TaxID=165716 RepID=A0A7J0G905_9ERIC|nr:mitochondrially targeted single-stranded DNA binding protein [Actinidia rufa]